MKARNKLISTSLLLLSALPAGAVTAYPGLIRMSQQDGTELKVRLVGDEYCHMTLTEDGYGLVFNEKTRNYEYAALRDGKLESSGIMATAPELRTAEATDFLSKVDRTALEAKFNADMAAARAEWAPKPVVTASNAGQQRIVRISDVPTIGEHDALVILVEFEDKRFSDCEGMIDPKDYYDRFFHEEGFSDYGCHGSVYDYYHAGSNERYKPNFRVFGPVRVSGGYADYAGGSGHEFTPKMIIEAVRLVDEQYDVDFADFDTDGDGVADNVYCLYAGYGRADSPVRDSIWPHSYNLKASGQQIEVDGVTVDRYTVSQQVNGQTDLPVGIGTFVHEFGHVLGLADHYNNSSSFGNPPNNVGNWDLMSSGSYNNDQNCPAPFSAFERYSLGWMEPEVIDPAKPGYIDIASFMDTKQAYRINVTDDDREYFLIENRQQKDWDEYLPGHGVLVWHIQEDQAAWDQNRPNSDQNHQRVDIVEAGNILTSSGSSSDPFPGTMDIRTYSFMNWSGSRQFGFEWVEEDQDGNCRFLLSDSGHLLPAPEIQLRDVMGTSACLSWDGGQMVNSYEIRLLKDDEEVFYHASEEPSTVMLKDLETETEYTVRVSGKRNSLHTETAERKFTTLARQIEEYTAEAWPAHDITDDGFLARWRAIPTATDYTVQLIGRTHDAQGELIHGFDDFSTTSPNLPEGWELTPRQGRNDTDFGKAVPSIRLRDDQAMLKVAVPGEKIDSISFWFSLSKAGIVLTVEKAVDGVWSEAWRYSTDRKRALTQKLDVSPCDSVRFYVSREDGVTGGYLLLDDIKVNYITDQFSPIRDINVGPAYSQPFEDGPVCSCRIDGLTPGENYSFRVRGELNGRFSPWSDVMNVVEGMKDPEVIDPSGVAAIDAAKALEGTIYNLQGIRIMTPKEQLPAGIYIINGRKVKL